MTESIRSSRCFHCGPRNALPGAITLLAVLLVGCGDNCFSGFFNGGFEINTASPRSGCGLTTAKGAVVTAAVQAPSCESCTSSARAEHLYVMLRGVQLHPGATADRSSPDWVDVAPQLRNEPRQVEFIGASEPEILTDKTIIPAGTYRQVRLEFLPDSATDSELLPAKSRCGGTLLNCVVRGDGRIEPVLWPEDAPELVITSESVDGGAIVVLPDTTTALQIRLQAHQVFSSSASEPWVTRVILVGRASVARDRNSQVD
jgi:Domain of unknown function (DUF4382)